MVVTSYGVGQHVKLPGPSASRPNVYDFGTEYQYIYNDLVSKDPELYKKNGLLQMAERNVKVKKSAERWLDASSEQLDVVLTFDVKIFEIVVEDIVFRRKNQKGALVVVVNISVKDN